MSSWKSRYAEAGPIAAALNAARWSGGSMQNLLPQKCASLELWRAAAWANSD
jgi:hypothetical protein